MSVKESRSISLKAGSSTFIFAAKNGCWRSAQILLIQPNIDISAQDSDFRTALDYAEEGAMLEVGGAFTQIVLAIKKKKAASQLQASKQELP